jgi:glycosyltransferase involved in cell wall biosynthesis
MTVPHICHVFSSFEAGGAELRTIQIINSLGSDFRHTIIATDRRYGARDRVAAHVDVTFVEPPAGKGRLLYGLAFKAALQRLKPALLTTYNFGAIDAVVGARLGKICPVVHAEDGFGPDEAVRLKQRRVLARRVVLRNIFATVVPSRTLWRAAVTRYRLPRARVRFIPNGVDVARFRPRRDRSWRRAHGIPDTAVLVGFVGALRPEKRLAHLLRAVSQLGRADVRVALVGDGPCRRELQALAASLGLHDRVLFAGSVTDPSPAYASFDVFAMSSSIEQMPIALLEAMASGIAALGTDVGDTAEMLGDTPVCVVPRDDLEAYTDALATLTSNVALREDLGAHNRKRCVSEFSDTRMLAEYRQLYGAALADDRSIVVGGAFSGRDYARG